MACAWTKKRGTSSAALDTPRPLVSPDRDLLSILGTLAGIYFALRNL